MQNVSKLFRSQANQRCRNIDLKIAIGANTYSINDIISCNIYSSDSSGNGITIGSAEADRLTIDLKSTHKFKSGIKIIPYIKYDNTEWVQLGVYYLTQSTVENSITYIEAYDMMYYLDKRCSFNGNETIKALSFPATMQQMLDYICEMKHLDCDFECQPFEVLYRPIADEDVTDSSKYYTQREILGFIASAHGTNVHFDNKGALCFKSVATAVDNISIDDCISYSFDSEEDFEIKGIRFVVGDNSIFINDNGETYNDSMDGIVESENPLASIEIAEYVWHILGGFKYCGCSITRRGRGWLECGDVLTFTDGENINNIVVNSLDYSFNNGFIEKIESVAETSAQSSNRSSNSETSPSAMAIYYNVNSEEITLQNLRTMLVSIRFQARVTCIPLYSVIVPLHITTAGTVNFELIYDNNSIAIFRELFNVGEHFKTIVMPLLNTANGGHIIQLWITSDTATGIIKSSEVYATVSGAGLTKSEQWDGTLSFETAFMPISHNNSFVDINKIKVSNNTEQQIPLSNDIQAIIPTIKIFDITNISPFSSTIKSGFYPTLDYYDYTFTQIYLHFSEMLIDDTTIVGSKDAFYIYGYESGVCKQYVVSSIELLKDCQTVILTFDSFEAVDDIVKLQYNAENGQIHNDIFKIGNIEIDIFVYNTANWVKIEELEFDFDTIDAEGGLWQYGKYI